MGHHTYDITLKWTGNKGAGTFDYRVYERSHVISVENKNDILGSSDPKFRGDKSRHNPEELLVASLSACHMLWYLHLCAENGVIVIDYIDNASGTMIEKPDRSGHFSEVVLKPLVTLAEKSMEPKAYELHSDANKLCFIANSVNFPVRHEPQFKLID